jgi:hypothetical protein
VSAVVFASGLPVLLLILPGGAPVDRWDRRTVMWTGDIRLATPPSSTSAGMR